MSNIDVYVQHALTTRFEDLPDAVVEKTGIFLLDSLGVGIAGAGASLASAVRASAQGWGLVFNGLPGGIQLQDELSFASEQFLP